MTSREGLCILLDHLLAEEESLERLLDCSRDIQEALVGAAPSVLTSALERQSEVLAAVRRSDALRLDAARRLAATFSLDDEAPTVTRLEPHLEPAQAETLRRHGERCRDLVSRLASVQRVNALLAEKSLACVEGLRRAMVDALVESRDYRRSGRRATQDEIPSVLDRRA